MEGDSAGVVSYGKKTSWDLFNLRRNVGEVGEVGVDFRLPALRRPPGLFDMVDCIDRPHPDRPDLVSAEF